MIKLPCRCGHRFELADDMAGRSIQCPACGKLVDVPALSELPDINEDGTYKAAPLSLPSEPHRLKELQRAFEPSHVDELGREYDLRPTIEQVRKSGVDESGRGRELRRPARPKYDPETGELIEMVELAEQKPLDAIPVAPQPVSYARPAIDEEPPIPFIRVPLVLMMPRNVVVLIAVFIMHAVLNATVYIAAQGFLLTGPGIVLLFVALLAHWGNVIDETGPTARDEAPAPLRHAQMYDDILHPFVSVLWCTAICYGPAIAVLPAAPEFARSGLALGLFAAGSVVYPALLLAACTSGTLSNLRPDRLLGLMRVCGARYAMAVVLATAGVGVYGWGWAALTLHAGSSGMLGWTVDGLFGLSSPLAYPVLFAGIYLMHLFCWYLGVLYRDLHDAFPWIMQRHIPTKDLERAGAARPPS